MAARPGTGKSTLALDIARHAAVKHRETAVIFSLEMSKTEITMRLLSAEAGIRLSQMRSGGDLNPGAVPAAGRWVADFRDGVGGGRGEEFGVFDPRVSAGPRGTRPAGGALWSGHQPGFTANRKLRKLRDLRDRCPRLDLGRSRPPAWLASRSAPAPAASSAFWARTLRFGRRHIDPGR